MDARPLVQQNGLDLAADYRVREWVLSKISHRDLMYSMRTIVNNSILYPGNLLRVDCRCSYYTHKNGNCEMDSLTIVIIFLCISNQNMLYILNIYSFY